jgi:tetratricopeptide (TPR) repeat protein
VNRLRGTKRIFAVVVAASLALLATRSAMAADNRELRAREAFAAQRYQDALDLFAKLYAETLHPIYLRNIGRCYQNLDQPDQAISSFKEYLRKAKNLPADETHEIEGFIKEMEDLKAKKEASASGATPPKAETSDSTVKPLPSATQPPAGGTANASLIVKPAEPPPEESSPIYGRWWFWAIVAGVVAAGVGVAFATGVFTKTEDAGCPMNTMCTP